MGLRPVHIAAGEVEAEIVCGFLRAQGVRCSHRRTGPRAARRGLLDGFAEQEVLVLEEDVDRATALLRPPGGVPADATSEE